MNYVSWVAFDCSVISMTCTFLFWWYKGNHLDVKKSAPEIFLIAKSRGRLAEVFCANFHHKNRTSSSTIYSRYSRFLKNECFPRFSRVNVSVRLLNISSLVIVIRWMQLRESLRCFSLASKHHELFDDNVALLCIYAVMLLNKCRIHPR